MGHSTRIDEGQRNWHSENPESIFAIIADLFLLQAFLAHSPNNHNTVSTFQIGVLAVSKHLSFLLSLTLCLFFSAAGTSVVAQQQEKSGDSKKTTKSPEQRQKKAEQRKKKQATEVKAIKEVLTKQADAWNQGNLEGYMDGYWKSKKLSFSSGGKTTNGWQATLDGYRRRYNPPAGMGKLKFNGLEVQLLGGRIALVLGKWHLTMEDGSTPNGNFSLILRKFKKGWKVIHDHTSLLKPVEKKKTSKKE